MALKRIGTTKKDDSGITESSFFAEKSCTCLDNANYGQMLRLSE